MGWYELLEYNDVWKCNDDDDDGGKKKDIGTTQMRGPKKLSVLKALS